MVSHASEIIELLSFREHALEKRNMACPLPVICRYINTYIDDPVANSQFKKYFDALDDERSQSLKEFKNFNKDGLKMKWDSLKSSRFIDGVAFSLNDYLGAPKGLGNTEEHITRLENSFHAIMGHIDDISHELHVLNILFSKRMHQVDDACQYFIFIPDAGPIRYPDNMKRFMSYAFAKGFLNLSNKDHVRLLEYQKLLPLAHDVCFYGGVEVMQKDIEKLGDKSVKPETWSRDFTIDPF